MVAPSGAGKAVISEKQISPLGMEEGSGNCWVTPSVKIQTVGLVSQGGSRVGVNRQKGRHSERYFTLFTAVGLVKRQSLWSWNFPQNLTLEEGEGWKLYPSEEVLVP